MTSAAPSFLPHGRELTRADLHTLPDDGHRYELLDGALIVTPAPRIRHQDVVLNLAVALRSAVTPDLKVVVAPVDVVLADDTLLQPDVLIAPREAFTDIDLPGQPLLAIEVLSPSTRSIDLLLKKERLQRAGCQHYWVIDPEQPAATAWSLVDGVYREVTSAVDNEPFAVTSPVSVRFTPRELARA
ncbi:Uma2 family endonuclease [Gulosibacter faecalis]|uniref:Uma2 family endonuclease n=1 Tax=Gulosibacter faecalis TaxID=272240 RepID=A0ABW5UT42_9MICO|nr:Uma2 family endonuclease [Gulosibacter faecalis]